MHKPGVQIDKTMQQLSFLYAHFYIKAVIGLGPPMCDLAH